MLNEIKNPYELAGKIWQDLAQKQLFHVKSEVIWHYTSIESAFGIVNSEQLWLSDHRTLNDKNEGILPNTIGRNSLNEFERGFYPHLSQSERLRIDEITTSPDSVDPVFLMSFSEKKDCLSQWKGYAHGPFGISLGFNTQKVRESIEKSGGHIFSIKYDEDEFRKFVEIAHANGVFTIKHAENDENAMNQARTKIQELLGILNFVFKSPEWREESEVRMIIASHRDNARASYRKNNGSILPYWPIPIIPNEAITQAIILDRDPIKRNILNEFLASKGLNVDVEYSSLKMRF